MHIPLQKCAEGRSFVLVEHLLLPQHSTFRCCSWQASALIHPHILGSYADVHASKMGQRPFELLLHLVSGHAEGDGATTAFACTQAFSQAGDTALLSAEKAAFILAVLQALHSPVDQQEAQHCAALWLCGPIQFELVKVHHLASFSTDLSLEVESLLGTSTQLTQQCRCAAALCVLAVQQCVAC